MIDEAIEKWRAVAHVAEESDKNQAAGAWFSVGYLVQDKKPEDSISAYEEAIRLKPDYANAYINRGVAKAHLGQYDDAIADYDEAIRLKPDDTDSYYNRGIAKHKLDLKDEAQKDFETVLNLARNDANADLMAQAERMLRVLNEDEDS